MHTSVVKTNDFIRLPKILIPEAWCMLSGTFSINFLRFPSNSGIYSGIHASIPAARLNTAQKYQIKVAFLLVQILVKRTSIPAVAQMLFHMRNVIYYFSHCNYSNYNMKILIKKARPNRLQKFYIWHFPL
jgi:hypothetical protein